MIYQEWPTFEIHIVQTLLSSSGIIWRSETHKGKISISTTILQLYLLNLTVVFKQIFEIILGPMRGEVFDIEITSLLGSLVPYDIPFLFNFSISFLQSMPEIQFPAFSHVFILQTFNSLVSTLRSILSIFSNGIVEADKAELSKFVTLQNQGLYVTKLGEHFPDVFFGHFDWNILDINVIYELSDVSSFSRLELNWNRVRMHGCFINSFGSRVFVIEAHKSISSA